MEPQDVSERGPVTGQGFFRFFLQAFGRFLVDNRHRFGQIGIDPLDATPRPLWCLAFAVLKKRGEIAEISH
jgi:hypothetical protein